MLKYDPTNQVKGERRVVGFIDRSGDLWIRDKNDNIVVFYDGVINKSFNMIEWDMNVVTARKKYYSGDEIHLQFD